MKAPFPWPYVIADVVRIRKEAFERNSIMLATASRDGRKTLIRMEKEGGSGGKFCAQYSVRQMAGYRVAAIVPIGDKPDRADPFSSQVNAGNVAMLKGSWNDAYEAELKSFPFGTYSDQVDASSGAFTVLTPIKRPLGTFGQDHNGDRRRASLHSMGISV